MKKYHFASITEQNELLGIRPPEHPLLDVIKINSKKEDNPLSCEDGFTISANFYSISLKHITSGELLYGRTKYDCSNGTMLFIAPEQQLSGVGIKVDSVARTICFHEDYIRGHKLQEEIKKYHFFNYSVNEALHLSPKEEKQMAVIFDAIEAEYQNNLDAFTKELILSQLSTLLMYSNRYYYRQFLMRKELDTSVYDRFSKLLEARIQSVVDESSSIPEVEELAQSMNMTSRYLSDALKAETGKTTKDWIHKALIERSKDLLLSTKDSVATIAYSLGFEYPQYFSRLFKNKVGMTPSEYRTENITH
ncbi:putative AraC-type DNA-binding domain-containing protein [Vibrio nigripulchritudo SFn27]|uniref:Putative AraC-type DNA-binding domain-containing protein n=1 Tax=Vibrio nigripulchritudo TaxID=28173 RepID=U4KDD1_9VIBR|nr:helix-turn-helix transcriptional regulator [Vibrio nigripulchritudo]CCN81579.1 putative AraC-type DNA-binding domain-containing protein [Vibrio nigripulchritudo BLFn1]CCN91676.1 putative AraC-type DNA-binding domain-containing protein [Vibrio nigripulchritudo SFn27]CCN96560.1 putative AraC-type DNA-binding domain-containing protein [Vibrio nigripulchritudo ENn2]CCO38434.1 putative AraC-type DNA-binding domain-containing protein [Vibrio nigripulchritudo SFn135]CCO53891.1 putative AraC-type D